MSTPVTHDQLALSLFDAAQSAVRAFVSGSGAAAAASAFGPRVSAAALAAAIDGFDRDGWPTLKLVDADIVHGARGAYDAASDTIYLSRAFLLAYPDSPAAITAVIVEEIGHALDSRVNAVDAPGDEGAIFAALVAGDPPDGAALAALQAENDHGSITVDGHTSAVEFAAPVVGTKTLDGSLSDWTAAEQIDQTLSTSGYDIYGKFTGNSYVFALKAPVAIGADTTDWLNTDQNASTGFQIFGFAGGAEYNVNFDASGTPRLYTGDSGQTLVSSAISFGYSADRTIVEFAVPASAIGSPAAINTLWDVNDNTYLPSDYSATQYAVSAAAAPVRTDFTKHVGIVYSATSAAQFFDVTAYSQLFMAAQNQAAMAGIRYDILTEADLTNLSKLVNYDALIFPGFANVQSSQYAAIESTLTSLVQQYKVGLVVAGDFMTNDQTGAALPGDPYSRMRTLLDVQPVNGGFPANLTVNAGDTTHPMMQDYTANELIRSYSNVGWRAYVPVDVAGTSVLATQTVSGQTYDAVISTTTGGRNVHFSSDQMMGDNNLLWQAIDYAVNGSGISAGLQLSRQASIVASRTDMDQAMVMSDVSPANGSPGIYDKLLPILQQWKTQYNFVSSYYADIGNNPPTLQTNWAKSGQYYKQILAMGNELGSHTITHPSDTDALTASQIQSEFQGSRQIIEQQMSQILGRPFTVEGVAVPGDPENLGTALSIIQYYDYMSGGFSGSTAGYPGAIGYLNPAMAAQDKVYIAPNVEFDFTLVQFKGMTPAQAQAEWARQVGALTSHGEVPVVVWPWHDYGAAAWLNKPSGEPYYTTAMYTDFISRASAAGAEFVTLADLADRISDFNDSTVRVTVSGNTVTATVTSPDAGRFALDLDNLGTQKIASVSGWYAYDADSVFLPANGGTYTIQLGATPADVTHIIALPMRADLTSLSGNGTNLSFSIFGEGKVMIDLIDPAGKQLSVSGATVTSLVGDKLTLDLGAIGQHNVSVALSTPPAANHAPTFTVADGVVGTAFGSTVDEMNDLALQAGNKIVLAGTTLTASGRDFALVRFNADGSLDSTFDGDGRLTTNFSASGSGPTDDFAHDVAVQADGKLVAAGYRTNGAATDFALARYSANGVLDTSFGTAGKVITDFGGAEDIAWGVTTQADGKIVVAGHVRPNASTYDFGVVRYNANGTLDTTFSGDGRVTVDFSGGIDIPAAVAIQADGKILVGGRSDGAAALARFNANGTLDTTFDGDGRAVTALAGTFIRGMALQADGKIVLVGSSTHGGANEDIVVLRYNANGTLDTTFSGDGIVLSDSGGSDVGTDVVVQADGSILVTGYTQDASGATNAVLARYLPNGTLDGSLLGPAGVSVAIALQTDGKIVVGGSLQSQPFGAARYLADGSLDPAFDPVKVNTLGGSVVFTPGQGPVVLDRDVRAYDPDLVGTSYAGASVTLARNGGANAQDVFSATGDLGPLTQGGALVLAGMSVGTVSSNSNGRLTLTFNANATQDIVDHVLQSIGYSNASATLPASVQIAWNFSDGNTGAQGSGGALAVSGLSTVTFNHAPTIVSNGGGSAASISMAENGAAVTTVRATDGDSGQTLAYSIAGGADAARFTINAQTGALAFVTAPDFETPQDAGSNNVYNVIVAARDSAGATDTQAFAVTITNVAGATISGDNFANTLTGTAEEDRIYALGGNDTVFGNDGNDALYGYDGNDRLYGGAGADMLVGAAGDDLLVGGPGKNTLVGEAGNDIIDATLGTASNLLGGAGNDVYIVDNTTDTIVESANQGTDTVQTALASYALRDNLENLTYTSAGSFSGTGNALDNLVTGGAGNDVLRGLGGDDVLNGKAGNDTLVGGPGRNTLIGGAGNDVLDGTLGAGNQLIGGAGDDTYIVDSYADSIVEVANEGTDGVRTALASYLLRTNVENLTYTGSGNFIGTGNASANAISGGSGSDFLTGGLGSDRLTGGAGSDRFDYNSINEGLDTITDFTRGTGGDKLDISDVLVGYNPATSNINNFVHLIGTASTTVAVNADGVGSDFVSLATLQGVANTANLLNDLIAHGNLIVS